MRLELTTHDLWGLRVFHHIAIQAVAVAAAILTGLTSLFMLKSGTLTEGASMEFLPHRQPPESWIDWLDQRIVDMRVHGDTARIIEH